MSRRTNLIFLLTFMAGLLIFVGVRFYSAGTTVAPAEILPMLHEIKSMKARVRMGDHRNFDIDVPQTYWQEVLNTLSSAKVDNEPAKWRFMAELKLVVQTDQERTLQLYWLSEDDGAFSIMNEPSIENFGGGKTYFRGSDSSRLLKILERIHAESQAQEGSKH